MFGLFAELKSQEELHSSVSVDREEQVTSYYKIRQQLETLSRELLSFIQKPQYLLPFLQPGRLVKVVNGEDDFGWGVVVNFQKKANQSKVQLLCCFPSCRAMRECKSVFVQSKFNYCKRCFNTLQREWWGCLHQLDSWFDLLLFLVEMHFCGTVQSNACNVYLLFAIITFYIRIQDLLAHFKWFKLHASPGACLGFVLLTFAVILPLNPVEVLYSANFC